MPMLPATVAVAAVDVACCMLTMLLAPIEDR